eukprot:TRINITY_DN57584_c0_g1_i1.p1 TRINITY_DN57584_c0_g1~~TRINITY_DN57584_c0_g1_i1.p1  ORF type:complete len:1291 (-),score=208.35 TRINITY_DN57584_c0_g1_i1:459-4220(-)
MAASSVAPRICHPGGQGLMLPLAKEENELDKTLRAFLYLVVMVYFFSGVGNFCDVFMNAIEKIADQERTWILPSGVKTRVKVWNGTIANLTLMALGSSAPEILLSVIEVVGGGMHAGPLGPSTIVGSAAFNLMCIIAVCVVVIPNGQVRSIQRPAVFAVTAFFSVFAYLWMVFILSISTPDLIETWEGGSTFCFFFVLVIIAYLADIGVLSKKVPMLDTQRTQKAAADIGVELTDKDVVALNSISEPPLRRAISGSSLCSDNPISVGFSSTVIKVDEGCEEVLLPVEKFGHPQHGVGVEYTTKDGTLEIGKSHYVASHGFFEIPAGSSHAVLRLRPQLRHWISTTSSSDLWGKTRFFVVELVQARRLLEEPQESYASVEDQVRSERRPKVTVLESGNSVRAEIKSCAGEFTEQAGKLRLKKLQISHMPHTYRNTSLKLAVQREQGLTGEIRCRWCTASVSDMHSLSPCSSCDRLEGSLVFENGASEVEILIPIRPRPPWAKEEQFRVILTEDFATEDEESLNAVLLPDASECLVSVQAGTRQDDDATTARKVREWFQQRAHFAGQERFCPVEGFSLWAAQFVDGLTPVSGDEEDERNATALDWAFHVANLPWKLLAACVPPPVFLGGWLCFFMSLLGIGALTAIIGDLASLVGCCFDIPDEITAITIVALGTSLPDTLASKTAAINSETADDAIGNVTGSNAVNVFLGIGLPWMVASIYWSSEGATKEWIAKYPQQYDTYPNGGFVVKSGDLVFSVCVFTICALIVLTGIVYRRLKLKAELGGPQGAKINTSIFFVLLWFFYVGLVSAKLVAGPTAGMDFYIIAIVVAICALGLCMVLFSSLVSAWVTMQQQQECDKKQGLLDAVSAMSDVVDNLPEAGIVLRGGQSLARTSTLRSNRSSLRSGRSSRSSHANRSLRGSSRSHSAADSQESEALLSRTVTSSTCIPRAGDARMQSTQSNAEVRVDGTALGKLSGCVEELRERLCALEMGRSGDAGGATSQEAEHGLPIKETSHSASQVLPANEGQRTKAPSLELPSSRQPQDQGTKKTSSEASSCGRAAAEEENNCLPCCGRDTMGEKSNPLPSCSKDAIEEKSNRLPTVALGQRPVSQSKDAELGLKSGKSSPREESERGWGTTVHLASPSNRGSGTTVHNEASPRGSLTSQEGAGYATLLGTPSKQMELGSSSQRAPSHDGSIVSMASGDCSQASQPKATSYGRRTDGSTTSERASRTLAGSWSGISSTQKKKWREPQDTE